MDKSAKLIDELNTLSPELRELVKAGLADSYRLDYLQSMTDESEDGLVIMRDSTTGRGWRLHETKEHEGALPSVRAALDAYIADKVHNEMEGGA